MGLGGDAILQAGHKLAAVLFHREGEQVAAEDLITLADLVGQDALLFQQGQPRLISFRVVAFRAFGPVLLCSRFPGEESRVGFGQPLPHLGLILFKRLTG